MIKVADMVQQLQLKEGQKRPGAERTGLDRFRPVDLIFATADRKRATGGQFRELRRARLVRIDWNHRLAIMQPVGTKDTVSVHLDLILYFNQQAVV